ncbi:hypothetical protein GCK32_019599 [Trichostrongylus colubriformis]|uniref:Uncharacterized protein n=1 Tax=Trichostrongylus colubriformis TaxID=6319 RepID=A0AAN8FN74_TRICO
MRNEELEDAELEEEDAAGRQAALDKAASLTADLFEEEKEHADAPQTMVKEAAMEWKFATVKKLNRRTSEIIGEYSRRKDLMKVVVEPLLPVMELLPRTSNIRKQLLLVFDVYSRYVKRLLEISNGIGVNLFLKNKKWV